MRLHSWLLTVLSIAHSAIGHGGLKLLGGFDAVSNLQPRGASQFAPHVNHALQHRAALPQPGYIDERAVNLRCGPGNGSCPTGYCCSIGGYCGKDFHYCSGPACQLSYGDKCDGNTSPLGSSTKDVARPHLGNISYGGTGLYFCQNKTQVALTFDDGPYIFTEKVLDVLDQYSAKATFFITGNNMGKGQLDNASTGYPQLLKRMHAAGHQVASHTWTHQNLSAITVQQRQNQMYYNEMAFRNVLGFFPTYMRPPYSECNNETQAMLYDMGYHVVYYNIDSNDYLNDDPTLIQNSKDAINVQFATVNVTAGYPARFIVIDHDIHEQTAYNLTAWTLDRMLALGFGTSVTVGECLGDPPENWYRAASGAPADAAVSQSLANITPTPIPSSGPSPTACSGTVTLVV
ncbi:glycoside hydrolase/deacetylase [Hyaloscypha finlandica]|nr:glycoside hydrolase/deacetylase [Hyaloscypha finlandica]